MIIEYDETKSQAALVEWWNKMYADVLSSYPLIDFSTIDKNFKMKTCVDIGANIGCFSYLAAHHFENVVTFEPSYLISLLAKMKINYEHRFNNVLIHNLAVGKNTGDVVKLRCMPHDGQRNSGNSSTAFDNKTEEYELISTVSLETIFELCNTDFIDYLKIDCEGAEYDILLEKELNNIGIICGELHGRTSMDSLAVKKELLDHISTNFNVLASATNFFAVNKRFKMNPAHFFPREAITYAS